MQECGASNSPLPAQELRNRADRIGYNVWKIYNLEHYDTAFRCPSLHFVCCGFKGSYGYVEAQEKVLLNMFK